MWKSVRIFYIIKKLSIMKKNIIAITISSICLLSAISVWGAGARTNSFIDANAAALSAVASDDEGSIVDCFSQSEYDPTDKVKRTYYDCGKCIRRYGSGVGNSRICIYKGLDETLTSPDPGIIDPAA